MILIQTDAPSSGPRPVVRVVNPAGRRVLNIRKLPESKSTFPVRGGIPALYGPCPVEFGVAARHEIGMEIGDVPVSVGVDGRVARVRLKLHDLFELIVR